MLAITLCMIARCLACMLGVMRDLDLRGKKQRCGKSTVQCDTNHQSEKVPKYVNILHDCALFRMHARCDGRRRVTLRTNDVASRLSSAIPIIQSNILAIIQVHCML